MAILVTTPVPGQPKAPVGLLARGYAFAVVSLRLLIIAGWAAAVAAALVFLPPLNPGSGGLSELIPAGSPAAHAESDASKLFGFPLDAAVAVVQRDPRGLPTATQVLSCLRALSVSRLLIGVTGFLPNVDGKIATQQIAAALASGQFNQVPLMNGSNHDEQRFFVGLSFDLLGGGPVTAASYPAAIAQTVGTAAAVPAEAQYPLTSFASPDLAVGALGTDALFACPAHFLDELASRFVPTYAYEFNDENAPENYNPPVSFPYGAAFATEIQYLFPPANPTGLGLNLSPTSLNAAQQKLSDQMVSYWTEFAKSGNPNSDATPSWLRFHSRRDNIQSLNTPRPHPEFDFATVHKCAFWDQLSGRTLPPDDAR